MPKYTYLITLSYDGSSFYGWAKQPGKPSVQELIESSLSKTFQEEIKIRSASRLDKGVHAVRHFFLFELRIKFSSIVLLAILQKIFRRKILIKKVKAVKNFIFKERIKQKEYRYFINTGLLNIWKSNYRWEYCKEISPEMLIKTLSIFVGKHDFFNFCFWPRKNRTEKTIREIDEIKVKENKKIITIAIKAKGFLRYQVRAIIGEAINCLEGKTPIAVLKENLESAEKGKKYRFLAPPQGLYLWKVYFNLVPVVN